MRKGHTRLQEKVNEIGQDFSTAVEVNRRSWCGDIALEI